MDLVRVDAPQPPGTKSAARYAVDIIAIHGLNGDYERTWTDQPTGSFWLRDLLPLDIVGARIYSFSYDSRIFTDTVMTINDYALKLLGSISRERSSDEERNREIFLICHSLGGLVAKKALIIASQDITHQNTLDMTKGIAFFGTPHLGSLAADRAGPIANIIKMLHGDIRTDHLKTLGGKEISEELFSISQSFRFISTNLVLVSIYETRPTPPMNSIVVPKESALTNLPNEKQIPRNTDHRTLAKFTSKEDGCYGEFVAILKQLFKHEASEPSTRSQVELTPQESKCLHTLYVSEYENHKAAIERPIGGTCQWLLKHSAYLSWLQNPASNVMWISGGAGCGKSVLSSFVIDALRHDVKSGNLRSTICYHFFNDRDNNQRYAHFALCGVLHQLISANPPLIKHVLDAYQKKGSHITRDLRTLWDILVEIMSDPASGNAVIVLDALDECSEEGRQRLLDWIVELSAEQSLPSGRLKILLTSRPEFSIQTKLRALSVTTLRMEDEMNDLESDIKTVVSTKLEVIGYSKGLTAFVFQQLIENADGTFLWVALILRLLEESGDSSHRGVIGVLKGSSRGHNLFSVYHEILNRIPGHRQVEARKALQIVATAPRPLTLDEFNIAFAINPLDPADGMCDLESGLQQDLPRFLLRLCGPFIRIVDGKVHLVHQTAKEFLLATSNASSISPWTFEPARSNLFMAQICLWYLLNHSASSLSHKPRVPWLDTEDHSDGFLTYASTYWPTHFRDSKQCVDDRTVQEALRIHEQASSGLSPWFNHYWLAIGYSADHTPGLNAFVSASISGHDAVVELILQTNNPSSIAADSEGRSAFLWACRCGHQSTASLLFQTKYFDITASDADGCTALWWATWGGHLEVASLLLATPGIDVNSTDKNGRTPLHIASWLGHDSIINILLTHPDTNVDVKDSSGWTALTWASWRGRSSIVRQFIQRDDISTTASSQDNYRRTPLARACEKGHTDVVRQLLRLSNPATLDKERRSPLSLAAQAGNAALVGLLLTDPRVVAQADEQDESGQTPLFWAASEGREAAVNLLISLRTTKHGHKSVIDIDSPLYDEQTPLSIAAENGHLGVVRQLMQAGASPSSRDMDEKTPLWWAAFRGQTDVIRFLLSTGVDPNRADRGGHRTPLLVAVEEGYEDVVRELVRACPSVRLNAKDSRGKTALWVAARSGREDMVRMLLERRTEYPSEDLSDAAAAADAAHSHIAELILGPDRRASAPEPITRGSSVFGGTPALRSTASESQGKWNLKGLARRFT